MSGSNFYGAKFFGMLQESLELDFAVTQDVGVGCPACAVFGEEFLKSIFPVFGSKIPGM